MKSLVAFIWAVVIGALLALSGPAWSDENGKEKEGEAKETIEMAAAAKVTIHQAIKTALGKIAGKVVEAEIEKKREMVAWEVEVAMSESEVMEFHIDAENGSAIEVKEE